MSNSLLTCSYFNAQCLTNKIDELKFFLTSKKERYDIVFVTETWLSQDIDFNVDQDYFVFRSDRKNRQHGGCLAFVLRSFMVKCINTICFDGFIELLHICIISKQHDVHVILIYRSPLTAENVDAKLCEYLNTLVSLPNLFILGDLNLPNLFKGGVINPLLNQGKSYDTFGNVFIDLGLIQKVLAPTRGENFLDVLLTNDPHLITNVCVAEPFCSSDHNVVFFSLNINLNKRVQQNFQFYDFRNGDYIAYSAFLDTIAWIELFSDSNDIDELYEVFEHVNHYATELFVPKVRSKINRNKWSKATRKKYRVKSKLWRRYRLYK